MVASIDRVGVSTQKIQNVNVDIRILDENDAVHDYFITFEDFKNRITKRKIQISQLKYENQAKPHDRFRMHREKALIPWAKARWPRPGTGRS